MNHVKIVSSCKPWSTRIELDGQPLKHVRSLSIEFPEPGALPVLKIEILCLDGVDIEADCVTEVETTTLDQLHGLKTFALRAPRPGEECKPENSIRES